MLLNSIALLLALVLLVALAGRGNVFAVRPAGDRREGREGRDGRAGRAPLEASQASPEAPASLPSSDERQAGRARFFVTLFRLALFVAIAASAALVVEYQNAGDPAFCGVTSGCFAVRISPYSRFLGVPLPNLGLAAFTALLTASLLARARWHHVAIAAASAVGGLAAAALLGLQSLVIGAFCAWCVAVDLAAFAAAITSALVARQAWRMPARAFERAAQGGSLGVTVWGAAAAAAVGLPFLWGSHPVVPPLPPELAALQEPGKITIVAFTDFECPFCRRLHPELSKIEEPYGDRVRHVRKMVPLPIHPGALPAAKAYVCTPEDKREQAAALLYSAPPSKLTDERVASVLSPLGLSAAELAACLAAPETQAAIDADVALYGRMEARGLPTTYVGRRLVVAYNPERIRDALRREAAGDDMSLPLPWLFVALFGAAAVAVLVGGRDRSRGAADEGGAAPSSSSPERS
ncbi:vitamin K epoxide reductase family protein [Sorangium atrum]|uniref:Vitamin K epoxide reductase family protein n=1 Tax=Sorangium atrum TaxID=2995308 RepID=A0ABT5C189_9BACT|nr:vitamin K epoxide reductase family protein [Sorangium aterium]MDC0679743.1 vitamin K epoxide reductase family protein [Sorangium aterium]